MIPLNALLIAARSGREAVRVLCAGLTDDALRATIERIARTEPQIPDADERGIRAARLARAALETERDRRTVEARTPPGLQSEDDHAR